MVIIEMFALTCEHFLLGVLEYHEQNGVNFLQCLALRGGGLDDSSRLDVVEIARVPDMLSSLFLPGRAKDLSAPRYTASVFKLTHQHRVA